MKSNYQVTISTGTFVKAVLVVIVMGFLWYIHEIVIIFLASLLLAALIEPFAELFAKRNIPRVLSVLIVYVVLLTIIVLIAVGLAPIIAEQFTQVTSNASTFSAEITSALAKVQTFSAQHGLSQDISKTLQGMEESISQSTNSLFSTVKGIVGSFATGIIIAVLTFYMVAEGDKMQKYLKSLAPVEYQPYISELMKKMQVKIGAWLRGQLFLGMIIGLASFIGLSILHVRYALLLAVIAGLCEMIPYIGPIFSAIPAAIVAFAQTPMLGLIVVVMYLIIQQVENHLLVPKVMQKITGLNPIVSIVGLLVGVKLGGVPGAFFAIPVAMMLTLIVEDLFDHQTRL
ncbi:MAG: AI-2E family transporter [Candidatus Uhrbacteria bacterium]|nr:AI-2E family transporter [Candidatus Uhrbacteria bacterium]